MGRAVAGPGFASLLPQPGVGEQTTHRRPAGNLRTKRSKASPANWSMTTPRSATSQDRRSPFLRRTKEHLPSSIADTWALSPTRSIYARAWLARRKLVEVEFPRQGLLGDGPGRAPRSLRQAANGSRAGDIGSSGSSVLRGRRRGWTRWRCTGSLPALVDDIPDAVRETTPDVAVGRDLVGWIAVHRRLRASCRSRDKQQTPYRLRVRRGVRFRFGSPRPLRHPLARGLVESSLDVGRVGKMRRMRIAAGPWTETHR
jgi:hypothetical protein